MLKNYFINTTEDVDIVTVLHEVNSTLRESGVVEGLVTITVPEAGGALAVMEPLAGIVDQFKEALRIYPGEGVEIKNRRKEDVDVGPRIAAAMLGRTLQIPVSKGKLVLGLREEPMIIDLEKKGKRREFCVQIMGDPAQAAQQQKPQQRR